MSRRQCRPLKVFQSTLPARGATATAGCYGGSGWFLKPPPPPGGATPWRQPNALAVLNFQPPPPAGGATNLKLGYGGTQKISIHAPRTGSNRTSSSIFPGRPHFNPRSPHGERRKVLANWDNDLIISIHAPRTGSDNTKKHFEEDNTIFQSTLPARGATETWQYAHTRRRYFNPRSLHGERHGARHAQAAA